MHFYLSRRLLTNGGFNKHEKDDESIYCFTSLSANTLSYY